MISTAQQTPVKTLVDCLHYRSAAQSQRTAYTFLLDGETATEELTYGELGRKVRTIATYLRNVCAPGERVLLIYPPGLGFISAFFGCLEAGVIAVPAYPPRPNRSLERLQRIVTDADATVALTVDPVLSTLQRRLDQAPELKSLHWLATDSLPDTLTAPLDFSPAPDQIALLQYTSGSTASPKGVMITHANLCHNLQLIEQAFQHSPESRGVIWLPPYHDMGLVGGILQPLFVGFPVVLMSPLMFLQRPVRWLQAISRFRATTSGGPNFAYDLCVRKINPADIEELDLHCWDLAFNGAEPINFQAVQKFSQRFSPCGFRQDAFYPCYGMAEATLIVSGRRKNTGLIAKSLDKEALRRDRALPTSDPERARMVVGCGQGLTGQTLLIVNPESRRPCQDGEIGEIWLSGASIARGYWSNPSETAKTFGGELADGTGEKFLRTGDLGFIHQAEVFITGRLKDVIIINGANYYPQDIERTVEQCHPRLRPHACAAFSTDISGEERLVVVAEIERHYSDDAAQPGDQATLEKKIRRAITKNHDLQVFAVRFLKPSAMPKTSSGKIQRHICRDAFREGSLQLFWPVSD
ncbi:MAG: fatty acyl-AMP ligase [Cyanobacteria bacterium P01_H01_bin.15]